ncbi:MAG: NAD-dependent epimerase/dehydratase family protein [Clostridiales bacterium]|nr:NAD-dependent epimerase/dehydratase family protein [Clostridiales bacterium]
MEKKLCVLTGATGHIGYALLKELQKNGEKVRILIRKDLPIFDGIDCEKVYGDVTDLSSLEKAFEGADVVYHLAGIIEINTTDESRIYKVNVDGTKNVVAACKKCGVRRLVYASSVDVFPPLPEGQLMEELDSFDPDKLEGTYAKTKAIATQFVLDSGSDEFEVVVTHPGACIGPYDFKVSNVGEMVRMFMKGAFPVTMDFGAYNFVDVRDVAQGMYSAAYNGRNGACYILTGEVVSTGEMIHILSEKTGHHDPKLVLHKGMAEVFAPLAEEYYKLAHKTPLFTRYSIRKLVSNCNFSCERARRELGYDPMTAKQSLSDMVDWIAEYEKEK